MANDKDFTLINGIEVGGSTKNSLGTISDETLGFSIDAPTYTSKSLNTPFSYTLGLTLGKNGTRVYVTQYDAPATIVQYNLSTAYDLSTSSDPSKSLNVSSQAPYPAGIYFKSDGTKAYTLGMNNNDVFQYSLSTAWDISTGSYDNVTFQESGLSYRDIYFKPDGTKMYIVSSAGADNIRQYALSSAWDLSTASYESKSLDVSAQETSATEGVFLSSDGTKAYTVGQGTKAVAQYNLTTPFDISTGSYSGTSFSVSSQATTPTSLSFSDDGTNMYVLDAGDGDVHQYTSSKALKNVDLSTSNFFTHTPGGPTTYQFQNPAAVQTFQIQLTSGTEPVGNSFSTTLYTGTEATNSINNNLDLSTDGGLVWIKSRNNVDTSAHYLFDTARGVNKVLHSSGTGGEYTSANTLTSFNTTGFTLGNQDAVNSSLDNFVSWSFKKTPKFFDVVTYSGTGSAQSINHSLGQSPGMIIIKSTTNTENWQVWHRSVTGNLELDNTGAVNSSSIRITAVSSTNFTLGTFNTSNGSGQTYVAYVFSHDTTSDSMIQCGSYTGNGQSTGVTQNIGFRPQFMLFKNTSASSGWSLADSARGEDQLIEANTNGAESTADIVDFTDTGFTPKSNFSNTNTNGHTFIYMAIRSAAATSITYPSSVKFQGGLAPQIPATGETDLLTFSTKDGGTSYTGVHSIDNAS